MNKNPCYGCKSKDAHIWIGSYKNNDGSISKGSTFYFCKICLQKSPWFKTIHSSNCGNCVSITIKQKKK